MTDVFITSAVRTAIGRFGGIFKDIQVVDLGAAVIAEAVKRAGISPENVDEVVMGNVTQIVGPGGNPARIAAIKAGIPIPVPAHAVNCNCASGLTAIIAGARSVKAGDNQVVVAGGMENLSQSPHVSFKTRWGTRLGHADSQDFFLLALLDPLSNCTMDMTAENVARKYNITREEQDEWALMSQNRAEAAVKAGKFKDEIVPIPVTKKGTTVYLDTDEHPTFGTTKEGLAALKPAFRKEGTVTAGNASGINDAAAAVTLMSGARAKDLGAKPLARVVSYYTAGVDPAIMGMGPHPATEEALRRAGLTLKDIDLIECNEAFAAQIIGVERELKWNREVVNVNGSGIGLGHPIGATGARLTVTLLYEMRRQGAKLGLVTMCVGGGQGAAMIVELL